MMSSPQRGQHISLVSLPFCQLVPPDPHDSSLSTVLQSHAVELFWTVLSDSRLLHRGTLCQLNFACPKDNGSPGTNPCPRPTFLSKLKTRLFHKSCPGLSKSASDITPSRSEPSYLASPWPPDLTPLHRTLSPTATWTAFSCIFRLLFLLYCMTLRYFYGQRLIKHYYHNNNNNYYYDYYLRLANKYHIISALSHASYSPLLDPPNLGHPVTIQFTCST